MVGPLKCQVVLSVMRGEARASSCISYPRLLENITLDTGDECFLTYISISGSKCMVSTLLEAGHKSMMHVDLAE